MKFFKIFFLIVNFVFSAFAKNNFEVKAAIVDVQYILEHSIAIQGIKKSIESISQDIQTYISKKELEFRKMEEELIKKRESLDESSFNKEVNLFNQRVNETQKEMQARKVKLEQAHAEAVGKVQESMNAIIKGLKNKYDFNIVFPSSQIIFAEGELNITTEVINLLNAKIKSVKINYKDE